MLSATTLARDQQWERTPRMTISSSDSSSSYFYNVIPELTHQELVGRAFTAPRKSRDMAFLTIHWQTWQ